MMRVRSRDPRAHRAFVALCSSLQGLGRRLGRGSRRRGIRTAMAGAGSGRDGVRRGTIEALAKELDLAGIELRPEEVMAAADALSTLLAVSFLICALAFWMFSETQYVLAFILAAAASAFMTREAIVSFPGNAARRMAARIMKESPQAANLMIMSLRHEPSLSKAIRFGAQNGSELSDELKSCTWKVLMGKHASFEEALEELGDRWAPYDSDLKESVHAMVTASCEATEDGKRRALDRANNAIISGAKRRIEAYALSLSTPSMVIFGLGILLPLMVGSFLPMLSWNVWSYDHDAGPMPGSGQMRTLVQTVFLMNVLFPAIGMLVAMGAVSSHPLQSSRPRTATRPRSWHSLALPFAITAVSAATALWRLDGLLRSVALLFSFVSPLSVWLLVMGRSERMTALAGDAGLEDALFRSGARMLEGENFESAVSRAAVDLKGPSATLLRRLSLSSIAPGDDFASTGSEETLGQSQNALEGFRVVKEAARKDELSAGMLAMDLAAYLKDLHDLEKTLKSKLRPTISMMRATAYALGPVVLGVTFAIYLSLTAIAGPAATGLAGGDFFIVLGVFLAETNIVVSYFVWGVEGRNDRGELMSTLGVCMLVSELVYSATAMFAS